MFNWVVRVVPQPPDPLAEEQDKTCVSNYAVKKTPLNHNDEEQNSLSSTTSNGVLTWLSNGFVSALPQPTTNSAAKLVTPEDDSRQGGGVIGWISQGLGKVVPQPDVEKYKEDVKPTDNLTEVFDVKDLPDAEPLPHIPVVELFSDDEVDNLQERFPPKVIDWLKNSVENVIPQPPPGVTSEPSSRRTTPCSEKVYSPPPESITSANDEDLKNSNVVGWIKQGLGRMMPQPVIKGKEDGGGNGDMVIQHGGRALRAP